MKIHGILSLVIAVALPFSVVGAGQDAASADKHFDPLGKPPSAHTLKAIEKDSDGLPFSDTRDFDEAGKGFIAELDSWKVLGPEGNVV